MRTTDTPKADAAGSGTRDRLSIMQRKPAGLLHYYMPVTQAVCTTENKENLARRGPNWRQFPAWSRDSAFPISRLQMLAPGGMTECYRIGEVGQPGGSISAHTIQRHPFILSQHTSYKVSK